MAAAMTDASVAPAAESDPVVARYNVFLKPQLPAHQKLLVLQYPNKVDKASSLTSAGLAPTEFRVKKNSGMVEIDVPLDYNSAYDRTKGMAWGGALASSTKAKAGGSHGLAGGFGVGGVQVNRGRPLGATAGGQSASAAASGGAVEGHHYGSQDWSEAVRQDRVLRLQTLGGMCPPTRSAEARWMIGVFDGGNLHLTPVSSLVHLRPQLHHIDAEADLDRQKHAGADGGAAGGRGGAGGGGPAARAIHMTIKSAGVDGDEVVTETMADRLRAVQMENWTRLAYVGDDDENSWDVYNQTLFLREAATVAAEAAAAAAASTSASAGGSGSTRDGNDDNDYDDKEKSASDIISQAATADGKPLFAKVPALRTAWQEDDLLQAISGIQKPAGDGYTGGPATAADVARLAARLKGQGRGQGKTGSRNKNKDKGKEREDAVFAADAAIVKEEPAAAEAAVPAPTIRRGRPGPASSGALPPSRGRGGRTRQAGRGSAMEID